MTTEVQYENVGRRLPAVLLGGTRLNVNNVDEALEKSGLNWHVTKSEEPVRVPVLTGEGVTNVTFAEKFITYRSNPNDDQMTALGVVGTDYRVIQNADAFSFLDNLVDDSGAEYVSAGSLKGGRTVYVYLKMPKTMTFAGNTDAIDTYLMVKSSHDGSKSFTATVQSLRQICTNGLTGLVENASFALRHTTYAAGRIAQARDVLQLVHQYEDAFELEVQKLLSEDFNRQDFVRFIEKLVPDKISAKTEKPSKSVETTRDELMSLWSAPTQAIVAGTKWAAYNAVAEWADWVKPVRGNRLEEIERAERNVSGLSDSIKHKAYALLS